MVQLKSATFWNNTFTFCIFRCWDVMWRSEESLEFASGCRNRPAKQQTYATFDMKGLTNELNTDSLNPNTLTDNELFMHTLLECITTHHKRTQSATIIISDCEYEWKVTVGLRCTWFPNTDSTSTRPQCCYNKVYLQIHWILNMCSYHICINTAGIT